MVTPAPAEYDLSAGVEGLTAEDYAQYDDDEDMEQYRCARPACL